MTPFKDKKLNDKLQKELKEWMAKMSDQLTEEEKEYYSRMVMGLEDNE